MKGKKASANGDRPGMEEETVDLILLASGLRESYSFLSGSLNCIDP